MRTLDNVLSSAPNNGMQLTALRAAADAGRSTDPPMDSGEPDRPDNGRSVPFLPKLLLLMTVPLFLGYFIKNFLFPRAVFFIMYNWAILSLIAVPILCG